MIISTVGADFFHAEGRTDMTKIILASRNFSDAPKKKTSSVYDCTVEDVEI